MREIEADIFRPLDGSWTKITSMGAVTELVVLEKPPSPPCCVRLDADHYVDLRTGEVLDYEHIENRSGSLRSIRNTLATVRALVNTNITDPECCRWVTLTYAQPDGKPMTDRKRLYNDYALFWKRLVYWCKRQGYSKPEYISVIEPQASGAWHAHVFFIWEGQAPFIPNSTMAALWRQGFTKTKQPRDCDNIGAYFSAYLADLPLDEVQQLQREQQRKALSATGVVNEKEFSDEQGRIKSKKFVKGGRLHLYPPKMNIIRTSRGIRRPVVELTAFNKAKEKVSAATETFSRTFTIHDNGGNPINKCYKGYYNNRVAQKQAPT